MAIVMAALSHKPATTKSFWSISPAVKLSFFHTGVSIPGLQLQSRLAVYEKVSWHISVPVLKWWHPFFKQYVRSSCKITFSPLHQITMTSHSAIWTVPVRIFSYDGRDN
jgi:hypothetical protein